MSKTQYATKQQAAITREPKTARVERELDRILKRDGAIRLDVVVAEARAKDSPIHDCFEWDTRKAAEAYLLRQAADLVRATRFVVYLAEERAKPPRPAAVTEATRETVRKFLPRGAKGEGFGFRQDVLADDDQRLLLCERKVAVLRGWCRETVDMPELAKLREGLARLLEAWK